MIIGESLKQTKIVAFFDLIPFPPNHRYNNAYTTKQNSHQELFKKGLL